MGARVEAATAARNNAEWCDIVCRSHGIVGTFEADLWASSRRTPPLYPDAVTLDRDVTGGRILSLVDVATSGCSVKDSFSSVDLSKAGFSILLEAEWIARDADRRVHDQRLPSGWRRIRTPARLKDWCSGWAEGEVADRTWLPFLPALLKQPAVGFYGRFVGVGCDAGFVLNRSRSAVGVTNLFGPDAVKGEAWSACVTAAAEFAPGLPVVGYESGAALAGADAHGFVRLGPLRVWIAQ